MLNKAKRGILQSIYL